MSTHDYSSTNDDRRTNEHDIDLEYELSETKSVIEQAPTGCPVCGKELTAGPYGTWQCWHCRETLSGRGWGL